MKRLNASILIINIFVQNKNLDWQKCKKDICIHPKPKALSKTILYKV